jgi:hypothetical protein
MLFRSAPVRFFTSQKPARPSKNCDTTAIEIITPSSLFHTIGVLYPQRSCITIHRPYHRLASATSFVRIVGLLTPESDPFFTVVGVTSGTAVYVV